MFGYSDWKLRNKLTIPLLCVVVLSAVGITLSFNTMIDELTEDALPEERAIAGIRHASLDLIGEYREFVIDPSELVLREIDEIKETIEKFEDAFEETAGLETDEQRFVQEIEDAEQHLKKTGDELVVLRQALVEQLNALETIEDKFETTEADILALARKTQPVMKTTDAKTDPDHLSQERNLSTKLAFSLSRRVAELREYLTNPDDDTKEEIAELTETGLTDLATLQRLIRHDPEKTASFRDVQSNFQALERIGAEIVQLSDAYHLQLERLEDAADALHKILDTIGLSITAEVNKAISDGFFSVNAALVISLVSVFAIGWFVSIAVVKSVNSLSRVAEAYGAGDLDAKIDMSQKDEIGLLGRTFEKMAANLQKNIKDREQIQKALKDSRDRTETIMGRIVDGIVVCREDGTIETANLAAGKIFGIYASDMVGKSLDSLLAEEDVTVAAKTDIKPSILAETGQTAEFERASSSGVTIWVEVAATSLKLGKEEILIVSFRDITERKAADRMKTEFVSTVSHELRTPLTSIKGSLGLIITGAFGEIPEKMGRMIELAENNTTRLINLVNDLLDMEKMQSGELVFHMEKESLTEIVTNSLESNKPFADDRKVKFKLTETAPDAFVRGDGNRLAQVMTNLLSNAAKFSPEGETVGVSLVRRDGGFRISVSDRGPGVPDAFRDRLFDRFTQADASDIRQKGGTGLGLNISRAIVEKHGGVIDVESVPGEGSTFYFDLPEYGKDHQPSQSPVISVERTEKPKVLKGHRILVIEDDPDVAGLVTIMLEQYGAVCDTAHDVTEARKKLAGSTYQAITLDMLLPDGNGVDFLQELRANDATKDIPVVVVSVVAHESREEVLTSVMKVMDWLEKPIDEKRLIRAVRRGTDLSANGHNKILIVEDDADVTEVLTKLIGDLADVTVAETVEEAKSELEMTRWSLMILDIGLPDGSGVVLIPLLKNKGNKPTPVIVFSAEEVGDDIARQVERVLVKSRTSNEELLETIVAAISKSEGIGT